MCGCDRRGSAIAISTKLHPRLLNSASMKTRARANQRLKWTRSATPAFAASIFGDRRTRKRLTAPPDRGPDGRLADTTGMEHSPTSATGTGWEPTLRHATQWAAREALDRASRQ